VLRRFVRYFIGCVDLSPMLLSQLLAAAANVIADFPSAGPQRLVQSIR
jgi:hypothetical protein